MKKCKYAKDYKAIYPPKCNGGDWCDACKAKIQAACCHPVEYLEYVAIPNTIGNKLTCTRCRMDLSAFNLSAFGVLADQFLMQKIMELFRKVENIQSDVRYLEDNVVYRE